MSDLSEADATEADRLLLECRVCLEEKSVRFMSWDIFTPLTEKGFSAGTTIALELSRLAKVEICDVDGYPKYICKSCLENLISAIELVRDVKKSEETLAHKKQTGKLDVVQTWPKPIELDKNLNEEILRNSMDVEVKQEITSDDDFEDTGMDDDKQDNLSLTDIKIEPDDITEHPAIQVTVNGTITHAQHEQISSTTNGFEVYENEEYLEAISDPVIKEEPMSDEDVPDDLPMNCMLCTKKFNSLSGLKAHVITHHNYKSVKRKSPGSASPVLAQENSLSSGFAAMAVNKKYGCTICKRIFTTSTDLQVHEVIHNKFPCFVCCEIFDTFLQLSRHKKRCKVKPKVVKPKTLRDILDERLAKKQSIEESESVKRPVHNKENTTPDQIKSNQRPDTSDTQGQIEKDKLRELVEIEIDIKKEVIDDDQKENEIKIKSEVDYNKIETELEGIFKNAFDGPNIEGSIEQKEKKKSDSNKILKEDGSLNTVDTTNDDKGQEKDTTSSEEQVLNTTIDKEEHNKNNDIETPTEKSNDSNEEISNNIITGSISEVCNNTEQKLQDGQNDSSELKNQADVNSMEVDEPENNNHDENMDINNTNETSDCKIINEKCENSHVKTELVLSNDG